MAGVPATAEAAMTDEEALARLEQLAAAAMPGPWVASDGLVEADGCRVADVGWGDVPGAEAGHNGEFIAAAREAVPALCAEVRRLRAENEKLRAVVGEDSYPCVVCGRPIVRRQAGPLSRLVRADRETCSATCRTKRYRQRKASGGDA
jgi:hypothetical protein